MTAHLVMFSGGLGSWLAAQRVSYEVGPERVRLVFADTRMEDEDLGCFSGEAAE